MRGTETSLAFSPAHTQHFAVTHFPSPFILPATAHMFPAFNLEEIYKYTSGKNRHMTRFKFSGEIYFLFLLDVQIQLQIKKHVSNLIPFFNVCICLITFFYSLLFVFQQSPSRITLVILGIVYCYYLLFKCTNN